jgi:hypothetical protein
MGKKPVDLPVRPRPGTKLFINLKTAAKAHRPHRAERFVGECQPGD